MGEAVTLITPVGRFVQGDVFQGSDKDHQGHLRTDKSGNPKMQWFVGLAIAKTDPGWGALWAMMGQVAQRDFPGGEYNSPTFAWKIVDGDAPANATKEGFPGHWVIRCTSGFAPSVHDNTPQCGVITDPNAVRRGYYLRLSLSIKGNGKPANGKPGLYVNLGMVQLVGYGPVIQSGPDAATAFASPAALPAGASATPLATGPAPAAPGPAPAAPLSPGVDPAHWAAPAAPAAPGPAVAPTAPAPDYLHPGAPAAPANPVPAPAPGYPAAAPAPVAPVPGAGYPPAAPAAPAAPVAPAGPAHPAYPGQ